MSKILFLLNGIKNISQSHETVIKIAGGHGAEIVALYIFDEGVRDMLGDEWIATSETRMNFYRYYEDLLHKDANKVLEAFISKSKQYNISVVQDIKIGEPIRVLTDMLSSPSSQFSAAVMLNPKHAVPAEGGIKFNTDKFLKKICCPVVFLPKAVKKPAR